MEKEHEIKTVVPALRFPEFREMGGWRKSYIYEECPNSYSGGTPKTTEKIFYGDIYKAAKEIYRLKL